MRLSIALIAGAVVVVAAVAVWRASEPGASPTNLATSASESTTVQTSPSAEATLAEIAVITDDVSRNAAMYRLARDATREQVKEWLAQVETLPSTPHRYDVARVLYIRFTIIDPEAALDHALRGATKPAWLEAIFRTWAQLDPDAAIAQASVLRSSAKAAASRAVRKWAVEDPNATLAWMLSREDGEAVSLVRLPLSVLARRDPDHAIALLATIPQMLRYNATNAVLRTLAGRDLDRALGLFATFDIADQSRHARTLGRHLIESRSVEEAFDWAVSLDHRIRARTVVGMINDIHEADPTEALRRLESIDAPSLRAEAAHELVWREARRDAHAALTWALDFESRLGLRQTPLGP